MSLESEKTNIFVTAGFLQGDTLALYLFAIVIDYVMRRAIGDKAHDLGFTLYPRKSRRVHSVNVTDLCFANDIALLADNYQQAQEFLRLVETEAAKVGLHVNGSKTKLMSFNQDEPSNVTTISGYKLKEVDNFKYLGCWMKSTEDDIKVRKALAWTACHKLRKMWTSSLKRSIKVHLFIARHCVRHPEEIASQLVLWQPVRGNAGRGRKTTDFIDVIKRETNLDSTEDIRNVMLDRNWWREFVNLARSGDQPR